MLFSIWLSVSVPARGNGLSYYSLVSLLVSASPEYHRNVNYKKHPYCMFLLGTPQCNKNQILIPLHHCWQSWVLNCSPELRKSRGISGCHFLETTTAADISSIPHDFDQSQSTNFRHNSLSSLTHRLELNVRSRFIIPSPNIVIKSLCGNLDIA